MQKGFTFDVNRCTGCEACRIACSIENRLDPEIDWRRIHSFNSRHHPAVPALHNSMACNHCEDPACMAHCPALAYSKDPAGGAVTIDENKCIGCKNCWVFCPETAIEWDVETKKPSIRYNACKGCGLCANECPVDAIEMVRVEA